MAETVRDKLYKIIDHYADSGDVSRDELVDQLANLVREEVAEAIDGERALDEAGPR